MKNTIKKLSKFITSRMLYLLLGLFLAVAIFTVRAAWDTKVNTGDVFTTALWNDMVDKLVDLDRRTIELGNCYSVSTLVNAGNPGPVWTYCNNGYVMTGVNSGYSLGNWAGYFLLEYQCCQIIFN